MTSDKKYFYCEDSRGYVLFSLPETIPTSELAATFTCNALSLEVSVISTDVGLDSTIEAAWYLVAFPFITQKGAQKICISRKAENAISFIKTIHVHPESFKVHKSLRALGHLQRYDKQYAIMLGAMERFDKEHARMSLLGLYPINSSEMVCRAQLTIPSTYADQKWNWTIHRDSKSSTSLEYLTLDDSNSNDNGKRIIVISCRMPRDIANPVVVAAPENAVVAEAYLGIPPVLREETLDRFYKLTTDVRADIRYPGWFISHRATQLELENQTKLQPKDSPKISVIIPVYNPPIEYLDACIRSILAQTYRNWQLILVNASPAHKEGCKYLSKLDDPRITLVNLKENLGIAGNTNEGIKAATGDFFSFVDQDDIIEPNTLYEYAKAIANEPTTDLLYCDEDSFEGDLSQVRTPMLKPNENLDFLFGHNYVVHMLTVSRWAYDKVEPSPDYSSGAQDYDLTLKVFETGRNIAHIPKVLYHWRQHAGSTNDGNMAAKPYAEEAGKRVLEDYFNRRNLKAHVEIAESPAVYECKFEVPQNNPKVDVIITGSSQTRAETCAEAVKKSTDYSNVESHILTQERFKNQAALKNQAAKEANGDYLLFLDDSIQAISSNLVSSMLGCFQREEIGIVGALTFCADGLIHHAGLALMSDGSIGWMNSLHTLKTNKGYLGSTECAREYSATSSECLMISRNLFEKIRGFDESLSDDYSDFDFCLKAQQEDFLILYLPYVTAAHCNGGRPRPDKDSALKDATAIRMKWSDVYSNGDPLLTPNCNKASNYYGLELTKQS